jgi:hypothetical protein
MALRVNAAIAFLSLCLGNLLVQFVSPDANQFLALFSAHVPKGVDAGNATIKIILLLLPLVCTSIFLMRTIKGRGRLAINLLPSIGTGLVLSLLVTPLLPENLSHSVIQSGLWAQIKQSEDLVVGLSAVACLFVLMLQRPKSGHDKEKHSKH